MFTIVITTKIIMIIAIIIKITITCCLGTLEQLFIGTILHSLRELGSQTFLIMMMIAMMMMMIAIMIMMIVIRILVIAI